MPNPSSPLPPPAQNPVDIAREAFRRLATRRVAPTPEAYRDIYNEIAGIAPPAPAPLPLSGPAPEEVLGGFATQLTETPGELADYGRRLNRAVQQRDWDGYARALSQLVEKHLKRGIPPGVTYGMESKDTRLLRELLSRTLAFALASLLPASPTLAREAESLGAAVKIAHSDAAL
ncbi:MAG: diguanylate cyclase, partial [Massilia sp.]|nr:diguanylate cyclase [Massilia sp.]